MVVGVTIETLLLFMLYYKAVIEGVRPKSVLGVNLFVFAMAGFCDPLVWPVVFGIETFRFTVWQLWTASFQICFFPMIGGCVGLWCGSEEMALRNLKEK